MPRYVTSLRWTKKASYHPSNVSFHAGCHHSVTTCSNVFLICKSCSCLYVTEPRQKWERLERKPARECHERKPTSCRQASVDMFCLQFPTLSFCFRGNSKTWRFGLKLKGKIIFVCHSTVSSVSLVSPVCGQVGFVYFFRYLHLPLVFPFCATFISYSTEI